MSPSCETQIHLISLTRDVGTLCSQAGYCPRKGVPSLDPWYFSPSHCSRLQAPPTQSYWGPSFPASGEGCTQDPCLCLEHRSKSQGLGSSLSPPRHRLASQTRVQVTPDHREHPPECQANLRMGRAAFGHSWEHCVRVESSGSTVSPPPF